MRKQDHGGINFTLQWVSDTQQSLENRMDEQGIPFANTVNKEGDLACSRIALYKYSANFASLR